MKTSQTEIEIDISNLNPKKIKKTKSFIQKDAFLEVAKILRNDLNIKGTKKLVRTHNTIFLNGKRGSGKTQFLLGIKNYIKKETKVKGLYFFNPIDPTLLHDNESFLTIIIAKILNSLESEKNIHSSSEYKKEFYKTLTDLANAIDGIINNKYKQESALENIAQDQTSLKLEEYMHNFFKLVTKILNKKRLVILIDDVDMAFEKGFEVLEVIRKYLASPYVIPVVTGDLELYQVIIENNFLKRLDDNLKIECKERNKKVTIDYLVKVLPTHRRVRIQTIYELSVSNTIIFKYNNKNKYYFFSRKISKIPYDDKKFYFRRHAYEIFKAEEAVSIFVENLFSNSLRNIIQFMHREYSLDPIKLSLSNIEKLQELEKKYNIILLDNVMTWRTYYIEAQKNLQNNEYDIAIKNCEKSLDIEEHYETYYLLGNCYYNISLLDKSEEMYKKTIELNKDDNKAYSKLGDIYRKKKEFDKAIDAYKKSLKISPTYDAYNRLGICYIHIENIEKAVRNFKNAIQYDSSIPKAYLNLIELSFITNKEYYDKEFEKEFQKQFSTDLEKMKSYDMIKILKLIRKGIDENIIDKLYKSWELKYQGIVNLDWSFDEIELVIKKESNKVLKKRLLKYLDRFKEKM